MKKGNQYATPWSLHFDRDGTEDIAIIRDAHGEMLVSSRGFWLPESADPIPATLAAVRLMIAAPRLLYALQSLAESVKTAAPAGGQTPRFKWALGHALALLAEIRRQITDDRPP